MKSTNHTASHSAVLSTFILLSLNVGISFINWCILHCCAGLSVPPSSWTIISEDQQTRVLVAKDRELFVLKQSEQHALPVVS
jgi:hypothetical protein